MQYYATGNLKHNGKRYERGALVDVADEAAERLMAIGALTTEPIAAPEAENAPQEPAQEPQDGAEAAEEGEEAPEAPEAENAPKTASKGRRMRALSPDTKEENDPSAGL